MTREEVPPRNPPHVQMVFQDPFSSLNPRRKAADLVAQGPIVHGTPPAKAMRRGQGAVHPGRARSIGLRPLSRTNSPAASASASGWPARSRCIRRYWLPTKRSRRWTCRCRRKYCSCSPDCARTSVFPSSSSPMISGRRANLRPRRGHEGRRSGGTRAGRRRLRPSAASLHKGAGGIRYPAAILPGSVKRRCWLDCCRPIERSGDFARVAAPVGHQHQRREPA